MKVVASLLASLVLASLAHAGAWGEGSFENDDALDWVTECTRSDSVAPIQAALDVALRGKTLEAPEGSVAVAAAEVVAAALGKPSPKLPPDLREWIQRQPPEQVARLAPAARKALVRVRDLKNSELRQLWAEGKTNKWLDVIGELESRLGK
jgi:hypothetical protein